VWRWRSNSFNTCMHIEYDVCRYANSLVFRFIYSVRVWMLIICDFICGCMSNVASLTFMFVSQFVHRSFFTVLLTCVHFLTSRLCSTVVPPAVLACQRYNFCIHVEYRLPVCLFFNVFMFRLC
jgi:hypothetical protein